MPPRKTTTAIATTARAFRPITLEYVEALKSYSQLLYHGGLAPKGASRPESVAAIIEVGRDVGLPATQALANIMIVNGKPTIWGDAGMALIRASGKLVDNYPMESYQGVEGSDSYAAVFTIRRTNSTVERVTRFSIADAKRANLWSKKGPWQEYPYRQLMWRARSWGCRDEFQDVLCGLAFTEEVIDFEPSKDDPSHYVPVRKIEPQDTTDPDHFPLTNTVTDEQLDRLVELRQAMFTGRGLKEEAEQDGAWLDELTPFNVDSATKLLRAQADQLIIKLEKEHDPFAGHPPLPKVATT